MYVRPTLEVMGNLSVLIQGISGACADSGPHASGSSDDACEEDDD